MSWYQWAPYKPVAQRRREAEREAKRLTKKGQVLCPVHITGRTIAKTFWGKAWCEHLENYCDFSNRLPRGRTYARNGSILDLQISSGQIAALISGSNLYRIAITIQKIDKTRWKAVCSDSASSIHSVIDLMLGKLSPDVLQRLTEPKRGMFPSSNEIKLACSCPDGARLCKHLAAVLYGVGHRLDSAPELLFLLRGVDQRDLISESISAADSGSAIGLESQSAMEGDDLGAIFGIDLASTDAPAPEKKTRRPRQATLPKQAKPAAAKKVPAAKKATVKNSIAKKISAKKTAPKKGTVSKKKTAKKLKL